MDNMTSKKKKKGSNNSFIYSGNLASVSGIGTSFFLISLSLPVSVTDLLMQRFKEKNQKYCKLLLSTEKEFTYSQEKP